MLQHSTATGMAFSGALMMETIRSRFGDIHIDSGKTVIFPRGLLGMPDKARFALTGFPNPRMEQFTLLQSLDDAALSFITLPLQIQNAVIAEKDIRAACEDLQIDEANLALLLIVSVHRGPDEVRLSVNARAPLMIDSDRRIGVQHVFTQDNYSVQHLLN